MRQVTHALLTRPPLSHKIISPEGNQIKCFVRLACVKHAASVHPEPGSNSHVKSFNPARISGFSKSETSSYRNLDSGFTVFKVCFIKSCSFIFRWLELFSYESFKVIHCSVINVLCCFQQLWYIIIITCACQQLFYFISFIIWWASGEGGIWTLAPLLTTCTLSRGVPSASLGTSPNILHVI